MHVRFKVHVQDTRWMYSILLRERMGIESVSDAVKWNRLRWLGHGARWWKRT